MSFPAHRTGTPGGFSLIELLCVLAIIGILAGLLLGPAGRALGRARDLKWNTELGAHVEHIAERVRRHASRNPAYRFDSAAQMGEMVELGGPARRFLESTRVRFHPFGHGDPREQIVLEVRGAGRDPGLWVYPKAYLTEMPE